MTGLSGVSAYQQTNKAWEAKSKGTDRAVQTPPGKEQAQFSKETSSKIETKSWSPVSNTGSLVPSKTDYGFTIGDVQLSEKASDYLSKLKSKFGNMEFITVSKDMKAQVQKNAASYGNANKMVVLIDEEKLERMATDESFRKKYEGIIEMSRTKLLQAKNSLASSGADVKNFGMSVDSDGKESFFATVGKSQELQKERIEKRAAEKKAQKAKEKKKAEKEAQEERIRKSREKKAEKEEKTDAEDKLGEESERIAGEDDREYVIFEAGTLDELSSKVSAYGLESASSRVMTESERMVGTRIDFKG